MAIDSSTNLAKITNLWIPKNIDINNGNNLIDNKGNVVSEEDPDTYISANNYTLKVKLKGHAVLELPPLTLMAYSFYDSESGKTKRSNYTSASNNVQTFNLHENDEEEYYVSISRYSNGNALNELNYTLTKDQVLNQVYLYGTLADPTVKNLILLNDINNKLNVTYKNIINFNNSELWMRARLNGAGDVVTDVDYANIMTYNIQNCSIIMKNISTENIRYIIYSYNKNNEYSSSSSWVTLAINESATIELTNQKLGISSFINSDTRTIEDILSLVDISTNDNNTVTSDIQQNVYNAVQDQINNLSSKIQQSSSTSSISFSSSSELNIFINKFLNSRYNKNTYHFSIDDTNLCFSKLISNNPSSIFDIALFNMMKTVHDQTGAVWTLMCFLENNEGTYNMENIPNTWISEFQENKNWLRFAFHSQYFDTNYNTATGIGDAYDRFVAAVNNFAGSYDCIDRFPRLGYFGGTLSNIREIKARNYGPVGFLSADDNRLPYYFNITQRDICISKGSYIDFDEGLFFVRSFERMDSGTDQTIIDLIKQRPAYHKHIEIFFHENSNGNIDKQQYCINVANYCKNTIGCEARFLDSLYS